MSDTPYEDERYQFSTQLYVDDSEPAFLAFLQSCSMTVNVREKLISIYRLFTSNDTVLTNLSDEQILYKTKECKVKLAELKLSIIGFDTLSLLYPDFEIACDLILARVDQRYSRSYNGFERLATISSYTTHTNKEIFENKPAENREPLLGGLL